MEGKRVGVFGEMYMRGLRFLLYLSFLAVSIVAWAYEDGSLAFWGQDYVLFYRDKTALRCFELHDRCLIPLSP